MNIFDFSGDLYGKALTVEFVEFIRKEMHFDSPDELKAQMQADKLKADEIPEKQMSRTEALALQDTRRVE